MKLRLTRREALLAIASGSLAPCVGATFAREPIASPRVAGAMYRLEYKYPREELIYDLLHSERGDPKLESITPADAVPRPTL